MIFSWLRHRRRRKLLAQPFPDAWEAVLQRNVKHDASLSSSEQARLRDDLRVLVAEKTWIGIDGLVITDEIKVTIAAQASLLLLHLDHNFFAHTHDIILHPTSYETAQEYSEDGLIVEDGPEYLGEAYYRGPVVLSWAAALAGGRREDDGHNLVLHEFAHKLDMADGLSDGTPMLHHRAQYPDWAKTMTRAFNHLRDRAERGKATLLDEYGATDEAEFFACATECFFEKPLPLKTKYPDLYNALQAYYKQDPAARRS